MKPVTVLDIGSAKIVCLSGGFDRHDGLTIEDVSVYTCDVYRDGAILDEESLREAVIAVIRNHEQETHRRVRDIALTVPHAFAKLAVSEGVLPIEGHKRVTDEDIDEVINRSLDGIDAEGYVLMHSTPVSFLADGETVNGIPTGVRARELTARVSHMYASKAYIQTFEEILSGIGVEIRLSLSSGLSNALTVIPEIDRIRPSVLIDVGYYATELSVVENSAVIEARSLGIGGRQFTSDLSFGLDIPFEAAEIVKRRYVFLQEPLSPTEIVRLKDGAKRVEHGIIKLIMEARANELSGLISSALQEMGITPDSGTVVYLTGGGIAMQKNGPEFLGQNLQMALKEDTPWVQDMDTPNYTSAFAALDFVIRAIGDTDVAEPEEKPNRVADRLRRLFSN